MEANSPKQPVLCTTNAEEEVALGEPVEIPKPELTKIEKILLMSALSV